MEVEEQAIRWSIKDNNGNTVILKKSTFENHVTTCHGFLIAERQSRKEVFCMITRMNQRISKRYDKDFDVLYVMLKDAFTYTEDDPDYKNVVVKKAENDNSVVGFIIFDYRKKKTSFHKIIKKYNLAA